MGERKWRGKGLGFKQESQKKKRRSSKRKKELVLTQNGRVKKGQPALPRGKAYCRGGFSPQIQRGAIRRNMEGNW